MTVSPVSARPEQTQRASTGLNIAAVAKRTGIGADTLRKWERRYGVLRPSRTPGGQRRFDEIEVARVEWLRDRLAEGLRIGEAAALLDADAASPCSTTDLCTAIVAAVSRPDTRQLATLVEQAFTLLDVEAAIEEVIAPALRQVGDCWQEGPERIADEHLLSEAVRSRLRRLLGDRRHAVRGTAVLACAPGERHELGVLSLAVLLQADGWLAVYLGPDAPVKSSFALAERIGADLLCLSASTEDTAIRLADELEPVELPQGVRLAVGGRGTENASEQRLGEVVAGLRAG
jgi:methanogenic corrinoid protein MtbC1